MMDMVERVARAIARADEQNGGPPYEWRIAQGKHAKEQLFDQARAAIEAMRKPTEAMLTAGDIPGWDDNVTNELASEVWQAMIDAALIQA